VYVLAIVPLDVMARMLTDPVLSLHSVSNGMWHFSMLAVSQQKVHVWGQLMRQCIPVRCTQALSLGSFCHANAGSHSHVLVGSSCIVLCFA
jgi:hypothetical protein